MLSFGVNFNARITWAIGSFGFQRNNSLGRGEIGISFGRVFGMDYPPL